MKRVRPPNITIDKALLEAIPKTLTHYERELVLAELRAMLIDEAMLELFREQKISVSVKDSEVLWAIRGR